MCLALIAIEQHPVYSVIILSNRDEFYKRATSSAHYWPENPNLFAGQDLVSGGSWLGVNKSGSYALVTNYRNPITYNPLMQSRGLLVSNYLSEPESISPDAYIKNIAPTSKDFNPFNLIVGNNTNSIYYSNVEKKARKLTHGLYGLSNHLLDTPWYKILKAKELFNEKMDKLQKLRDPEQISELLFPVLINKTQSPDHLLPRTGVSLDLEKSLSSIFVNIPEHEYGTRSTTLILMEKNNIFFAEKSFVNAQVASFNTTHISL